MVRCVDETVGIVPLGTEAEFVTSYGDSNEASDCKVNENKGDAEVEDDANEGPEGSAMGGDAENVGKLDGVGDISKTETSASTENEAVKVPAK